MKLVIFTGSYPYKPGEEFLNDEIGILSSNFEEIIVVSAAKNTDSRDKYITPNNVRTVIVNRYYYINICILYGFIKMFSLESIREIFYSVVNLKYKLNLNLLKILFIYYVTYKRNYMWIKKNFKNNYSNIVFYSYWLSTGAYALAKLKKNGHIFKAIARAHGFDAFLNRGYQSFRREIYKYLDEIHFVSDTGCKQFQEKILLPENVHKAILYTSNLGILKHNQLINPQKENKDNIFHIVTCSSIIPLKRLDLLVDSLVFLKEYKIEWIHFGDGVYKDVIFELVKTKLSHLKNIEVDFKGQVKNEEILDFYEKHHVDIFINVSDYEGIPVSIMEAMSYGIPIIARDVGGNSEIVENGYNGVLLPKHTTAQEISQSILSLITLPKDCINEYRKNAFETWKNKFNAETNYNAFAKIIKQLLD